MLFLFLPLCVFNFEEYVFSPSIYLYLYAYTYTLKESWRTMGNTNVPVPIKFLWKTGEIKCHKTTINTTEHSSRVSLNQISNIYIHTYIHAWVFSLSENGFPRFLFRFVSWVCLRSTCSLSTRRHVHLDSTISGMKTFRNANASLVHCDGNL